MRISNPGDRSIAYHLNILGIITWEHRCQLVAKNSAGEWMPIGGARALPLELPEDLTDIEGDPLLLTVYQFELERPGSDLREVLTKSKDFEDALGETDYSQTAGI